MRRDCDRRLVEPFSKNMSFAATFDCLFGNTVNPICIVACGNTVKLVHSQVSWKSAQRRNFYRMHNGRRNDAQDAAPGKLELEGGERYG